MLFFKIRERTSFTALWTFNDKIYRAYRKANDALGILVDYAQWTDTLNDAVLTEHPKQIREILKVS